jgi:hypothetical protein
MIQIENTIIITMIEIVEAKTAKFQRAPFSFKIFRKNIDWTAH